MHGLPYLMTSAEHVVTRECLSTDGSLVCIAQERGCAVALPAPDGQEESHLRPT
jgi:hypothetical protein